MNRQSRAMRMHCVIDAGSIADASRRGCRRHSYSYFTKKAPSLPFASNTADNPAALDVWDYCRDRARLLFDTAPTDPTARRISQALDVTPEGLSRVQIRALFHRHVSKDRIDLISRSRPLWRIGRLRRNFHTYGA
jgi:hypothetical protein